MQIKINEMKINATQIYGGILINVDVSVKKIYVKKFMSGILLHVVVKIENIYQVIICDEVIEACDEEIKTIPTNFNEKKVACKMPNVYILLAFLFITISLLITVSIYFYLIKY